MPPVSELPERTPEKTHPSVWPAWFACSVTVELTRVPWMLTSVSQLPVPLTTPVESVNTESVRVIETGEHDTGG
jgi:hypothetical protein